MNAERSTNQKHRYLDSIDLAGDVDETIDGPIPSFQNGLHWRATVDKTPITLYARGYEAIGYIDGDVHAHGTIANVGQSNSEQKVTLYVEPTHY